MSTSPAPQTTSSPAERDRSRRWFAAAVCAAAGFAVFQFWGNANHGYIDTRSLFWWWGFQWMNPASETQHGWLILGLSVWLLWRNLRRYEVAARDGSGTSLVPAAFALFGGLVLHALGFTAQQARVSIAGLLLFAWGVARLGGGRRWGRAAAFPLTFLIFAIPLSVLDTLGFWLRMGVIDVSTALARLAGIDVIRNGTQLLAPDGRYSYDVAAACSGIRSLMAMAALSLLIGYLNFNSWWRRAGLFLLCFPLVFVGNVARICAIIVAAQAAGPRAGDLAHEVMGYAIFVIVLGGVLGAAELLRRSAPEASNLTGYRTAGRAPGLRPARAWPVVAAVVIVAAATAGLLHRVETMPARARVGVALAPDGVNPAELPTFLGREWIGSPAAVTAIEREILPPDTGYARMLYTSPRSARAVLLSIVLSGRDRTSIHRPELCLVGQGWTIRGRFVHTFPAEPLHFPVTVLRVERKVTRAGRETTVPQLVAYCFLNGDEVVATNGGRLARDAANRVLRARADRWAYVLLQTDAADGEPAALDRMNSVLGATAPFFTAVGQGRGQHAR